MRLLKIMLIPLLILGMLVTPLLGCSSQSGTAQVSENQVVTVQRGNITTDITAAGNLALSQTEDLAIDLFYSAGTKGTVGQVLVEEGDSVKEGQVLVTLDKDEWNDQLTTLEQNLTTAQRKVTTAQRGVTTAERQLATAQNNATAQVKTKEQALQQAQINLTNAEVALEKAQDTYHWPDIEVARAEVDKARANYEYALDGLAAGGSAWQRLAQREKATLIAAENKLNAMLTGADPNDIAIKKVQLEIAQANLKAAQDAIPQAEEDGRVAVANAQNAVDDAKLAVEDAKENVADAQKALDKAKSLSPEIKTPFDGFITKVNVEGGDEVLNGTVAVQIADSNKFEADILVSEMDIIKVKLGGDATVQLSAMSGVSLPAKVTHISPTATIQSGVVNYKVTVEIESLQPITQGQLASGNVFSDNISSGAPSGRFGQGFGSGNLTQEQINQMMQQRQQAQAGQPSGQPGTITPPGQRTLPSQQAPAAVSENVQLRQGLTATVSLIVSQKTNVLLVPNTTITAQGGKSYVQVLLPTGTTEERAIQTGITDYRYTEVISGLSEGEKVVISQETATQPTSTASQQRQPGGMGIPFLGR